MTAGRGTATVAARGRRAVLAGLLLVGGLAAVPGVVAAAPVAGAVVAWGDNHSGQLGIGIPGDQTAPTQVAGLTAGVVAVAAHTLHTLALRADGTVVAAGSNTSGQLGDGTTTDRTSPVAVTGLSGVGCPVGAPASCVAVAGGGAHSLALKVDGTVLAWGANNWGQLGDGTTTSRPAPVAVGGLGGAVVAIAGGGAHSLALRADGAVLAWGADTFGEVGDGNRTNLPVASPVTVTGLGAGSQVVAIAAGAANSYALKADGTVLSWGNNNRGNLGDGTRVVKSSPVLVSGLGPGSGVTALAAGARFGLVLKSDGTVLSWGSNQEAGQLGDGTTTNRLVPVQVTGLGPGSTVVGIAAGGAHGLALRANGTLVAWGANASGQLGDGTTTNRPTPVAVAGAAGVSAVAAGGSHSVALQGTAGAAGTAGPPPVPAPSAGIESPAPSAPVAALPPPNVVTSPPDATAFGNPTLANDPSDPLRLAIAYAARSRCFLSRTTDGGRTWTPQVLVGPDGAIPYPATSDGCGSPQVAYGPDGSLSYGFNASQGFGSSTVYLTASGNGGETFAPPRPVDPGVVDFLGDLAVDRSGGDLYLTWLRSASIGGPILVSRCSADALRGLAGGGPLACDPAVQATPAGSTATSTRALAVGGDGRVYVAWLESAEENNAAFDFIGPYTVQVASSVDHGHTFSAPTSADRLAFVCPTFTCPNEAGYVQMSLAAGPDPGHVVVAATGTGADGRARVRVTVSRDGAATWSARRTVGGRVGEADHEQHMPHLAVAPDGRVDLDYYDLRPDLGQDLFVASSTDGGTTFGSPRRFSDVSSDEAIISSSFSDDRVIGMASSNAGAYAAWADSRRGTRDSGKVDVVFATDAAPPGTGYRTAAADGGVFAFGSASFLGSMGSTHLNSPVVGMAASPTGRGYWLVASDGGVFAFGDARFLGSTASLHLSSPVVQVTATPTGLGYWLVAADGGVFAFGDARFLGSTGAIQLNRPVVALAPTPSGRGYWLVASDGGVFAFGDARFLGSTGGLTLNSPVVGAAATPTGRGYWLVAADGGVFAFGDARFLGSAGSLHLASPVVGMAATSSSRGYWLTARDGGVFAFGDARFLGSTGALVLRAPVVGLAA